MTEIKKSNGIWIGNMEQPDLSRLANRRMKKAISKKKGILGGRFLSKIKGRGMEFDESRPYQPGDEVRHIFAESVRNIGTKNFFNIII